MKIAVTGGNGFLGKHLLEQLRDTKVDVFDRAKHNLSKPGTLKEFVSQKDCIIHIAGVNRGQSDEIIEGNVLGTVGLLTAMRDYNPRARMIFASSFQVYVADSLYGLSKKLAEEAIAFYCTHFGLKGTILRIANIYGPGAKPFYNSVIATFVDKLKHGQSFHINGDGQQKRDYIEVSDVVSAIIKAIYFEQEDELLYFDICTGKKTSLTEIITLLEGLSGKKINAKYSNIEEKPWNIMKDYAAAKSLLSWEPKVNIEDGLKHLMGGD